MAESPNPRRIQEFCHPCRNFLSVRAKTRTCSGVKNLLAKRGRFFLIFAHEASEKFSLFIFYGVRHFCQFWDVSKLITTSELRSNSVPRSLPSGDFEMWFLKITAQARPMLDFDQVKIWLRFLGDHLAKTRSPGSSWLDRKSLFHFETSWRSGFLRRRPSLSLLRWLRPKMVKNELFYMINSNLTATLYFLFQGWKSALWSFFDRGSGIIPRSLKNRCLSTTSDPRSKNDQK